MANGRPVRSAEEWNERRAEIVELYETEIYGRVPAMRRRSRGRSPRPIRARAKART